MYWDNRTATVTFSRSTESFAGMRINGEMAKDGYVKNDIDAFASAFPLHDVDVYALADKTGLPREGWVVVVRKAFPGELTERVARDLQHGVIPKEDRQMYNARRKVVQNRQARYCCCLGDEAVEARIDEGIGCVVPYADVKGLAELRDRITSLGLEMGIPKMCALNGEVNHYYDAKRCYIGFHGDGERPDVIGFVVGASKTLHFQGFCGADPVGERVKIDVGHGDLYMMCEVACGHHWVKERGVAAQRQGTIHYRHAACDPSGNVHVPTNDKIREDRAKKAAKRERENHRPVGEEDGGSAKRARGGEA